MNASANQHLRARRRRDNNRRTPQRVHAHGADARAPSMAVADPAADEDADELRAGLDAVEQAQVDGRERVLVRLGAVLAKLARKGRRRLRRRKGLVAEAVVEGREEEQREGEDGGGCREARPVHDGAATLGARQEINKKNRQEEERGGEEKSSDEETAVSNVTSVSERWPDRGIYI